MDPLPSPSLNMAPRTSRVRSITLADVEPGQDVQRTKRARLSQQTEFDPSLLLDSNKDIGSETNGLKSRDAVESVQTEDLKQSGFGTTNATDAPGLVSVIETIGVLPPSDEDKIERRSAEQVSPQPDPPSTLMTLLDSNISDPICTDDSGVSDQTLSSLSASGSSLSVSANSPQVESQVLDSSMVELADLLDFTSFQHPCSPESQEFNKDIHTKIYLRMSDLARTLIHDYQLVIQTPRKQKGSLISKFFATFKGEKSKVPVKDEELYELLEVECYLRSAGHMDPFAHATAEQSISGRWFVFTLFFVTCINT